jgi:hypothetical protein
MKHKNSIYMTMEFMKNVILNKKFHCMYRNFHLSTKHEYLITNSISSTHSSTFISYHNFSQALLHNSFILMHFYHFTAASTLSRSHSFYFYFRRNIIFLYKHHSNLLHDVFLKRFEGFIAR